MLLSVITAVWRMVPVVAAVEWLAGSVFTAFHTLITTPATQLLLLPGLALVCLLKCVRVCGGGNMAPPCFF